MRKRNTLLVMTLFIGVLTLGIGYALTAPNIKIGLTATATENNENFKVILSAVDKGTATSATINDDNISANMGVTLSKVGDTQTATFTIKNESLNGLSAVINESNINCNYIGDEENEKYFEVTYDLANDSKNNTEVTLDQNSNNTTTLVVTVKLIESVLGSDIVGRYEIDLSGITAAK